MNDKWLQKRIRTTSAKWKCGAPSTKSVRTSGGDSRALNHVQGLLSSGPLAAAQETWVKLRLYAKNLPCIILFRLLNNSLIDYTSSFEMFMIATHCGACTSYFDSMHTHKCKMFIIRHHKIIPFLMQYSTCYFLFYSILLIENYYSILLRELNDALIYVKALRTEFGICLALLLLLHAGKIIFMCLNMTTGSKTQASMF